MLAILLSLVLCYSEPTESIVLTNGDDGSKFYRIPAIVRAKDGSLVTATDKRWYNTGDLPGKIDVVIKRSTDNGKTWGPAVMITPGLSDKYGYGDPSLVVDDKTGYILCMFSGIQGFFQSTAENPQHNYYCISKDNGITWSEMHDITAQLYGHECSHPERKHWYGMFLSSGAALQLKSGRIIVVGVVRRPNSGISNYAVYTDDLGEHWDVGLEPACTSGDESKVVELNNGDVLMSIRHSPHRFFAVSHDKGLTWDPYYDMDDLHDPACNGEIKRYTSTKTGHDKDRLIHSILYSNNGRKNLSVLVSYDEGKTWPVKKVLCSGPSVYSSVAFLEDGTICVYYERNKDDGFDMVVAEFSLEWLTDGADKYTPPNPAKINKKKK
ncbi:neuramidase [Tritrichomonas foetus]|uniref:Neuramidase n=1 Tax=Tritrichomonas foetus TaxID=1144522 RepID=A0A1J4JEZ0_9EUKA|nr:neuramidase [Tritrichomonas foetus]|eukprot:OHS97672.1 neuramidase [Tritrichomonas foetus]